MTPNLCHFNIFGEYSSITGILLYKYVHVWVCAHIHGSVYVCEYACIQIYVYPYVSVYAYAYIFMHDMDSALHKELYLVNLLALQYP